jgi:hypothetical protein
MPKWAGNIAQIIWSYRSNLHVDVSDSIQTGWLRTRVLFKQKKIFQFEFKYLAHTLEFI